VIGDYNLNLETLSLPMSRGYGNLKPWHVGMSGDVTLLNLMKKIFNSSNQSPSSAESLTSKLNSIDSGIESFIYRWTGAENISGNRGAFDGRKLAVLEVCDV
jgi:hypothetical protein